MFNILRNGVFNCDDNSVIRHYNDLELIKAIKIFLEKENVKTLCDFGCGNGFYVKNIIESGIECEAYDGNPHTEKLSDGIGKVLDLSQTFDLGKQFDCSMSLEVGEHIPKEFEDIFLDNIINHSKKYVLLSWAIIGQGGDGHVNERNNDYIIKRMEEKGLIFLETPTSFLRNGAEKYYFKNTIMVFQKKN